MQLGILAAPLLVVCLFMGTVNAVDGGRADGPGLGVFGVELRSDDLAESTSFFARLGFLVVQRGDDSAIMEKSGHRLILRRAPRGSPNQPPVRMNFYVNNLDPTFERLSKEGVRFLADSPHPISIGRSIPFADPAGNSFHLLEVKTFAVPDAPLPQVFNAGMDFPDLDAAEAFYADKLGIEASSRSYLPRTLPLKSIGSTSLVLHRDPTGDGPVDLMNPDSALVLETANLEATRHTLVARGVPVTVVEKSPGIKGRGLLFSDPGGHTLRVVERAPEGQTTLNDLSWLQGTWIRRDGADLLEETWSAPAGNSMVGVFRWIKGDQVWLYELLAISAATVRETDGLVFRLRHFHPDFVPWEEKDAAFYYPLQTAAAREVVFENPARTHPRRFIYRRSGNELAIHLHGVADGQEAETVYRFRAAAARAP